MRTVLAVTIALALCAPIAARAATTQADLDRMVSTYAQVQVVRVVETFENGAVATVDVMPSGQYRIASLGGQDPSLIIKIATQPVPNLSSSATAYTLKPLGQKTLDGAKAQGYQIASTDGTYTETLWVNEKHLPVSANVQTQGHTISVLYGDYDNSALIATQ